MAGIVTKRKGFCSVLILSKKKKKKRTLHLDPQRAGLMVKSKIIRDDCQNCMTILKYTLTGYISLSNGGWGKIIQIYDDVNLNNTILNF